MITIDELESRINELIEQFENDTEHNIFEITGNVGCGKSMFITRLGIKWENENKRVSWMRGAVPGEPSNYQYAHRINCILGGKPDLILVDLARLDLLGRREFYKKLVDHAGNCKVIIARQTSGELTLKPLVLDDVDN